MKSDLLEEFELIRVKGGLAKPEQIKALLFKLNCYIDAWGTASDMLKYSRLRFENEMKQMSVFRDILAEMKGKPDESSDTD